MALVDRAAKAHGRSRAWFAAQAIRRAAEAEAKLQEFLQEGIDAADRGDLVPHEEVMAMLDGWIDELEAECRG